MIEEQQSACALWTFGISTFNLHAQPPRGAAERLEGPSRPVAALAGSCAIVPTFDAFEALWAEGLLEAREL